LAPDPPPSVGLRRSWGPTLPHGFFRPALTTAVSTARHAAIDPSWHADDFDDRRLFAEQSTSLEIAP
jgi:hypothetical protein